MLAVLGAAFILLPVVGLVVRAPWGGLWGLLTRNDIVSSIRLSLVASVGATAMAIVLGIPLAWVLARAHLPGRSLLRALVILPMVMPPVVGGLALLLAFGRGGVIGQWLYRWFGVTIPYTTWAAVLAEAFVAMPFLVITAEAGFRAVDRRQEQAARTLGAGRFTVFRRVTLPLAWPSVLAGIVLCWARALGEFGATITFAGQSSRTDTLPISVFLAFQSDVAAAIAVSLVLLAVSVTVLVLLRDRWVGALRS